MTRGVNYIGFLRAGFGLGQAARGYIRALSGTGINVLPVDAGELLPGRSGRDRGTLSATLGNRDLLHPLSIVHINPDLLITFWNLVGNGFFQDRYTIGIWAWETPAFPSKWHNRFALLDEVWVGGSFMAGGISRVAPFPVVVMPHVVSSDPAKPDRDAFHISHNEYVFLFHFDAHSTYSRKNPMGVIRAFRKAFGPDEPARLVVKSINAGNNGHYNELRKRAEGLRVTFIDETMDQDRFARLLASIDAFVSLHRAEGFGLGIAEAMALGKPVIATGWSGNMDFMNETNSLPVRFELAPLAEADPPYEQGSLWAVPDIDDAARKMRLVFDNRSLGSEIGHLARATMLSGHSPRAVGRLMEQRLEGIGHGTGLGRKNLPPETVRKLRAGKASCLRWLCSVILTRLPARFTGIRTVLERTRNRVSATL